MGEALTQALAAGDPAAFAALYDRLGPRLYATAHTLAGSAAEAEDIVQDLFVELATHRHRLSEVNDLEAYLFTSLRHAVSRRWRRRDVHRRALEKLATEHRNDSPDVRASPVPDEELARAISHLPETQREVLALKIDGGLTFAEIARVKGLSLNTAASRYRYALSRLRQLLTPAQPATRPSKTVSS